MTPIPTSPTKPAMFNLLGLPFSVRRNFLDVMPLEDLYVLRKGSDAVKSLSSFRCKVVDKLNVNTDTFEDNFGFQNFKVSTFANEPASFFDASLQAYDGNRDLLDVNPVKDRYVSYKSDSVKAWTGFRGKVVEKPNVVTDTVGVNDDYPRLSDVVPRRFNTTPREHIRAQNRPSIRPDVSLPKVGRQHKRELCHPSKTTPVSTFATKPATVPFNLLSLSHGALHNFLDIMPVKHLHVLRKGSDTVKSLSKYRGEVMMDLRVVTDTVGDDFYGYMRFSEVMNRRCIITPVQLLDVHMGPDIVPNVLLSKMEGQHYRELWLTGNYDWKAVVTFLHAGVEVVSLHGFMHLPAENLKEFFNALVCCKVKYVSMQNTNYQPSWLFTAQKMFKNAVGVTEQFVDYYGLRHQITLTSDNAEIRIIGRAGAHHMEEMEFWELPLLYSDDE
uniref:F-box domain-containing protein n=1 Tax=Panagrellus redivivus TaxID=6233 RepID=A0A7E4VTA6_PANRE